MNKEKDMYIIAAPTFSKEGILCYNGYEKRRKGIVLYS